MFFFPIFTLVSFCFFSALAFFALSVLIFLLQPFPAFCLPFSCSHIITVGFMSFILHHLFVILSFIVILSFNFISPISLQFFPFVSIFSSRIVTLPLLHFSFHILYLLPLHVSPFTSCPPIPLHFPFFLFIFSPLLCFLVPCCFISLI